MAVAGSLTYDTKLDTKGFQSGLSKVGSATTSVLKGVGVAVGALATAIAGVTVSATKAYAEYEQLVGGVDTLFKESSKQLQKYADEAYKTAGLSANQYMSTVTSFSASLLQSLGGDTKQATEYANQAVIDMSDNANKMGTSMETLQYAYQSFARGQYVLLDNLKLGYGGTKTEMERLIADANRVKEANGEMADLSIDSFADVTEAIHIIQTEMGITGTTAEEASTTITGSINAMKGAWENLLVSFGKGEGVEEAINNLFDSISTVANNVMPVVMTILEQVPTFIEQLITLAVQQIPVIVNELIPSIINSAITILNTLIKGIQDNLDTIVNGAMTIIMTLINGILPMLPQILEMGIMILFELMKGIAEALPDLVPQIVNVIIKIMEVFNDNFNEFLLLGVKIILGLIEGLIKSIPDILKNLPTIIMAIINFFTLSKFLSIGKNIVTGLWNGMKGMKGNLGTWIKEFVKGIIEFFKHPIAGIKTVGKNLVEGLWNGIKNAKDWLLNKIKSFAKSITQGIKDFFGIKSPSRVMRDQVGQWLPKGIAVGIDANTDSALNSIDKMNDEIMNRMSQAVNMETAKASFSGTSGSVSQILSANSVIQVENYNTLELDGEVVYENQQTVEQRKNLQHSFGGGSAE